MTRVARRREHASYSGNRGRPRDRRNQSERRHISRPGRFVIKRDQPYGRLAKILLEKQDFPDPNLRTYDDTGWTMGLMTHTEVKEIAR